MSDELLTELIVLLAIIALFVVIGINSFNMVAYQDRSEWPVEPDLQQGRVNIYP